MQLHLFQRGFHFSQDGPGNRLVLHLQGCNLHCPWCANPEGIPRRPPLMQTGAPLPDSLCPHGAIAGGQLDRSRCAGCVARECVTEHSSPRLVCRGESVDVEELAADILSCRPMFFSGGGVTLTGGEATLQMEAVEELLRLLRDQDIHVALETNATHPQLERLFPLLGLLITDCKHYDSERHRRATGAGNETVTANLRRAAAAGIPLLVRVPLIGGFNAGREDIGGFIALFRSLTTAGKAPAVEFLPYHEFGREKWHQCGLPYTVERGFIEPGRREEFENAFRAAGMTVVRT